MYHHHRLLSSLLLVGVLSSEVSLKTEFHPQFEGSVSSNITVQEIYLNNESVSWVRGRDSHILTVDSEVFISDDRFHSQIQKLSNLWILKIRYVSARDAGRYECQVSTVPKISKFFELKVIIPKVDILGGPSLLVHTGTSLQLECVTSHVLRPPQFVMWQHQDTVTPGISSSSYSSSLGLVTRSVLTIERVSPSTAGEYYCMPDNISPASININIIKNKEEQLAVTNKAQTGCLQAPGLVLLGLAFLHQPVI